MKAKEVSQIMLLCSHCPKEFRYKSEKKRHELSHFPRFECDICSKKFSYVSALLRHQKQHARAGSVKCQECHRKFRDEVLLKRHIKYAHKGTFVCEECKSTFSSELALRTHKKTHKPESERRFKCSHEGCTKTFNFSHHLKHHELAHTDTKQHFCSYCGKGFIQSHHLKTHMKSHDPAEWLFCKHPGCKKRFSTEYARKKHMTTHKKRPDSGISSDSNSCDASTSVKDEVHVLCAKCGETVSQNEYQVHSVKCDMESKEVSIKEDLQAVVEEWPVNPFKPNTVQDKNKSEHFKEKKSKFNGHKICCQIDSKAKDNDSMDIDNENNTGIFENNDTSKLLDENIIDKIADDIKMDIEKIKSLTDYNQNEKDMCEGCDCENICHNKISMYLPAEVPTIEPPKINRKNVPNIEFRKDGVIKIIDTFDDDIVLDTEKNDCRFIPFSSCKDAIGNCLVNEGYGCLCARMMADEDQAMLAQEIDDITPQPNEPL